MTWLSAIPNSRQEDRAVAPIIGFILLFGIAVIAFSGYQAYSVPAQNEEVEVSHTQDVQDQLQTLRDAILSVGATGSTQSESVTLGTDYPSRVIAINPPPARGEIRTNTSSTVQINNATVAGSSNAALYWENQDHSYNTTLLAYSPEYNEYQTAPTTRYEHTLLYNDFDSGTVGLVDQSLISGNDLSVILLAGEIRETGSGSTTLSVHPDSAASTTLLIENDGSGPVTITMQTHLSAEEVDVFVEASESENVADVSLTDDEDLQVTLEEDQQYELRVARVGIGQFDSLSEPAYLVATDGTEVLEGQSFGVEVRDQFNNPVSAASISVEDDDCDLEDKETNSDGRANFTCSDVNGWEEVELSIAGGDEDWETVSVRVNTAGPGNGGPPENGGGPGGSGDPAN